MPKCGKCDVCRERRIVRATVMLEYEFPDMDSKNTAVRVIDEIEISVEPVRMFHLMPELEKVIENMIADFH